MQKEAYKLRIKAIKEQKAQWQNEKSDCLVYANLLVDYFNYMPKGKSFEEVEVRINEFCSLN